MATEQGTKPTSRQNARTARPSTGRLWTWLWTAVGVGAVLAVGWNTRNQPDERIGNPNVVGTPRPFAPLFGFGHSIPVLQIFTVVAVVLLIAAAVWGWRRYGPHPYLLMGLVTTIIVWQDPMMNSAPRGVRPASSALARVVAIRFARTHSRTVRRLRLCDVPVRSLLSGSLGTAADSGPAEYSTHSSGEVLRSASAY